MKSDTTLPLSPLGTARQRLAPALAYPAGLLSELRDADLGEESGVKEQNRGDGEREREPADEHGAI